jgi:hypothetical protein
MGGRAEGVREPFKEASGIEIFATTSAELCLTLKRRLTTRLSLGIRPEKGRADNY